MQGASGDGKDKIITGNVTHCPWLSPTINTLIQDLRHDIVLKDRELFGLREGAEQSASLLAKATKELSSVKNDRVRHHMQRKLVYLHEDV